MVYIKMIIDYVSSKQIDYCLMYDSFQLQYCKLFNKIMGYHYLQALYILMHVHYREIKEYIFLFENKLVAYNRLKMVWLHMNSKTHYPLFSLRVVTCVIYCHNNFSET
jgi:hypothetical protein